MIPTNVAEDKSKGDGCDILSESADKCSSKRGKFSATEPYINVKPMVLTRGVTLFLTISNWRVETFRV